MWFFSPEFLFCLCVNLDDSSVIILKIHKTGEKNSQVFRNTASTASGKRVTLASHKISRMFPREQRQREQERESREAERERARVRERGRERACVFWLFKVI